MMLNHLYFVAKWMRRRTGEEEGRGGRRKYKSESGSQQAAAVPYSNMTVWVTENLQSQISPQLAARSPASL